MKFVSIVHRSMTYCSSQPLIFLKGLFNFIYCLSSAASTFCVGAENEPDGSPDDWVRIAELQARNKACLPHLKSSYPVEFDVSIDTCTYGNIVILMCCTEILLKCYNCSFPPTFIMSILFYFTRLALVTPSSSQTKSFVQVTHLTPSVGHP